MTRSEDKHKSIRSANRWVYILGLTLLISFVAVLLLPLPSPLFPNDYSYTLMDRSGRLLQAKVAKDEQWRIPLPDSLPHRLSICQILYEDEYFYWHPGINPISLGRALRQNMRTGRVVSGGSTLSMQVVRLALGKNSRTYVQKLWEVLLTLKVELLYSKSEILRAYLQHAPYGGNIVGASAASWRYYGREINNLSWSEAAMLAVLPNNPGQIFPGRGQDQLLRKRNALIQKLHDRGYLDDNEVDLTLSEKLPSIWREIPQHAPHLAQSLQMRQPHSYRSKSSLSLDKQTLVNEVINDHVLRREGEEIGNAAAIVIDNMTREVLAYVGNADPGRAGSNRFVDMLDAPRSPGSLLKPFLYAQCLDKGFILPKQWLPDHPIYHQGFAPQNFDRSFRGAVPADRALASSLNVPFVHLLKEYGYERFYMDLQRVGIVLPELPGHYGMSLILGGFETTPLEIAGLYSGLYHAYRNFEGHSPNFLFKQNFDPVKVLVMKEQQEEDIEPVDWLSIHSIHHMLKAMTKVRKPEDLAYWDQQDIPVDIAWKTGTSYGLRDAWAVGISDEYTAVVWVGNATGEGRPGLIGSRVAAPILFNILDRLDATSTRYHSLGSPYGICQLSGMKISQLCSDTTFVDIPAEWYESPVCSFHKQVLVSKKSGLRVFKGCTKMDDAVEAVFTQLPAAMSAYYKGQNQAQGLPRWDPGCLPLNTDEGDLHLIYPIEGSRIRLGQDQAGNNPGLVLHAAHLDNDAEVFWYHNDSLMTSTKVVHKVTSSFTPGDHRITLVDNHGRRLQASFSIIE